MCATDSACRDPRRALFAFPGVMPAAPPPLPYPTRPPVVRVEEPPTASWARPAPGPRPRQASPSRVLDLLAFGVLYPACGLLLVYLVITLLAGG